MTNLSDPELTEIDYEDSKKLFAFSVGTVKIARDYQAARNQFATALKTLKIELAKAYKDRSIEKKYSEEKSYLILADRSPTCRNALMAKIDSEAQYKGLEKVLETRQAVTSLAQSLIKNRLQST